MAQRLIGLTYDRVALTAIPDVEALVMLDCRARAGREWAADLKSSQEADGPCPARSGPRSPMEPQDCGTPDEYLAQRRRAIWKRYLPEQSTLMDEQDGYIQEAMGHHVTVRKVGRMMNFGLLLNL